MRKFFSSITFALMAAVAQAYAQAPAVAPVVPVYAVLSLVGDELMVVVAQPKSDGKSSPYRREPLLIDESVFDDAAIRAAGDAIRKLIPRVELSALHTRSTVLFDRQRALFEEKGAVISVPDAIRTELQKQKATYLVLITKHRDDMNLQFETRPEGGGKLEGLGFYVDDTLITGAGTGESVRGFIAPYAYLRVALIDAKTWNVMAKQTITASTMIASAKAAESAGVWSTMTAAEKMRSMDRLLRREIGRVIPLMVKAG